jgi:hypothetical protein
MAQKSYESEMPLSFSVAKYLRPEVPLDGSTVCYGRGGQEAVEAGLHGFPSKLCGASDYGIWFLLVLDAAPHHLTEHARSPAWSQTGIDDFIFFG